MAGPAGWWLAGAAGFFVSHPVDRVLVQPASPSGVSTGALSFTNRRSRRGTPICWRPLGSRSWSTSRTELSLARMRHFWVANQKVLQGTGFERHAGGKTRYYYENDVYPIGDSTLYSGDDSLAPPGTHYRDRFRFFDGSCSGQHRRSPLEDDDHVRRARPGAPVWFARMARSSTA